MKLHIVVSSTAVLILFLESLFVTNLSSGVQAAARNRTKGQTRARARSTGQFTPRSRAQSSSSNPRNPSSPPSGVAFDPTPVFAPNLFNSLNLSNPECMRRITNLSFRPSLEAFMPTTDMIRKYGYPLEIHHVTTKDGYIIEMYRIPHGKLNTKTSENFPAAAGNTRPAVLMQHGMSASASEWLMQPGDDSLPYILANAGYDVWMTNERGVKYTKHKKYSATNFKYWQFSMDEMGLIDNPAIIDYVLEQTKEPKLYYIGHSMGGTLFYMCMSTYPEYNSKIRSFYGFGPAAYIGEITMPFVWIASLAPILGFLYRFIGFGEFMPPLMLPLINIFGPFVCAPSPLALTVCGGFMFALLGLDPCQFQTTEQISKITGHAPNPISYLSVIQYIQNLYSKKFQKYDYGRAGNLKNYGQATPPEYDLTKVTAPVCVIWGDNDPLVKPKDVQGAISELPNVISNFRVDWPTWSHGDFIFAIDAKRLLYEPMLKIMAKNYD